MDDRLAVPVDDHQRIVDADPEADHRGQNRRERRNVEKTRHERQCESGCQRDRNRSRGDGQERTQDRAEREQQDHQRDGDADALRGRRFTTDEDKHAVGPDLQAIAAVLLLDEIPRGDDVVGAQVVEGLAFENHRAVCDVAVRADAGLAEVRERALRLRRELLLALCGCSPCCSPC